VGFFLLKFVVFGESKIKGRIQLFRYFSFYIICLFLNYVLLKLFVEYIRIYPTIAQVMTTVIVVVFSYFVQKYFTFRIAISNEITN
jgi:putative flippase GtrA